jgi:hypothetical protein
MTTEACGDATVPVIGAIDTDNNLGAGDIQSLARSTPATASVRATSWSQSAAVTAQSRLPTTAPATAPWVAATIACLGLGFRELQYISRGESLRSSSV